MGLWINRRVWDVTVLDSITSGATTAVLSGIGESATPTGGFNHLVRGSQ